MGLYAWKSRDGGRVAEDRRRGRPRRWLGGLLGAGLLFAALAPGCDRTCEKVQTRRQRCVENDQQAKKLKQATDTAKATCQKHVARLQECLALESCEDFSACTERIFGDQHRAASR